MNEELKTFSIVTSALLVEFARLKDSRISLIRPLAQMEESVTPEVGLASRSTAPKDTIVQNRHLPPSNMHISVKQGSSVASVLESPPRPEIIARRLTIVPLAQESTTI